MPLPHLILVPGLMCDESVWERQARQLGTLSSITIADHGSLDSVEKMADSILDRAPDRFAIAGHSMGGRIAFQLFRRAPERVVGLALLDTVPTPRPAGIAGEQEAAHRYALLDIARRQGTRAMGAEWVKEMVYPDRLADAGLMKAILDMIARKTPDIFAAQLKALLDRPDSTPLLDKIQCPTMVLCGREDTWCGLGQHQEMSARIRGSRLVIVEKCGHMSTMERPEEVTLAMQEWVNSL